MTTTTRRFLCIRSIRWQALSLAFSVAVFLAGGIGSARAAPVAEGKFSFANVEQAAKDLAATPYQAPQPIAQPLRDLDYDTWRKIRFKPGSFSWGKNSGPFEVQFFHPGFLYDRTVTLHSVTGGNVRPLVVTKAMFDYSQVKELEEKLPTPLGAAGFRIHTAINTPAYRDEFVVFLGAAYFRAVAKWQVYGLSARGLAINTAQPDGEEFPWFREFWISP